MEPSSILMLGLSGVIVVTIIYYFYSKGGAG